MGLDQQILKLMEVRDEGAGLGDEVSEVLNQVTDRQMSQHSSER